MQMHFNVIDLSDQISNQNGISTLVCAECHNKTIVVTSHLDAVRKTQVKIAETKAANEISSAGKDENQPVSNTDNPGLAKVLNELRVVKKKKNHESKKKENRSDNQVNHFEVGDKVTCYDIHLKQNIDAVVVNRVTYGQYAIRTENNNRVVLRRSIFLSKK